MSLFSPTSVPHPGAGGCLVSGPPQRCSKFPVWSPRKLIEPGGSFHSMVERRDNSVCDVQVPARGPGILILAVLLFTNRKAAGNTHSLESLELLEMRKGKIPKSK